MYSVQSYQDSINKMYASVGFEVPQHPIEDLTKCAWRLEKKENGIIVYFSESHDIDVPMECFIIDIIKYKSDGIITIVEQDTSAFYDNADDVDGSDQDEEPLKISCIFLNSNIAPYSRATTESTIEFGKKRESFAWLRSILCKKM